MGKMLGTPTNDSRLSLVSLSACLIVAVALTGCSTCHVIVSKIEVDLKPRDLDQSKLILIKDFVTPAGIGRQNGTAGKAIRKCVMGGLASYGYYVRTYSAELEKSGTVVIDGTITHFERGSNLTRCVLSYFPYRLLVSPPADPLAAHAKANVRIYKGCVPSEVLAEFQVETWDSEALAGWNECLESHIAWGIVNYLKRRAGADLPTGKDSSPSWIRYAEK